MKIMLPLHGVHAIEAFGEVKALKDVGDYVAAGLFTDPVFGFENAPAIIMKKKPGQVLSTTNAFKAAVTARDIDSQTQLKRETLELMCAKVAKLAYYKGVLHE